MTEEQNEIPVLNPDNVKTVLVPMKAQVNVVMCTNCDGGSYRTDPEGEIQMGETPEESNFPHVCNSCGHKVYLPGDMGNIFYQNANIDASRAGLRDHYGHSGVIALIWARTYNHGIGHKGDLPWGRDYPTDLKWFKGVTLHNPDALLVVGRHTYEGLPSLPDRKFAVLTTNVSVKTPIDGTDDFYYPDVPTLLEEHTDTDLIVIGGGYCYQQWLPMADVVYETIIYGSYPTDTFGPILNADNYYNLDTHMVKDCDGKGKPVVFNIWLSNKIKGSLEEHIIRDRWNFSIQGKLSKTY